MPNGIYYSNHIQTMETLASTKNQKTSKPVSKMDNIGNLAKDDYTRYNMSRTRHGFASKNHSFAGLDHIYIDHCTERIARSHSNKARLTKITTTNGCFSTHICDSVSDNTNLYDSHERRLVYNCASDLVQNNLTHSFDENSNQCEIQGDEKKELPQNPDASMTSCKSKRTVLDIRNINNMKTLRRQGVVEGTCPNGIVRGQCVVDRTGIQQEEVSLKSPSSCSGDSNRSVLSSEGKLKSLTKHKTIRMDSLEMIESLLGSTAPIQSNAKPMRHRASNPLPTVTKKFGRKKRNSQPTNNKLEDYRLVVLGSGGVGKSSLVGQFLHGIFPAQYNPTVEESYRHLVQLPDGVFHTIEILDTAGLHQFPAMRRLSITSGDAFIVVFSLDSRDSFEEALELAKLIFEIKGAKNMSKIPVILVGNKSDLEDKKEVDEGEALTASLEHNLYAYIQTSAKDNANVQKLFSELMVYIFGVHERLQQAEAKRGSSLRNFGRQVSQRVRKLSQNTQRHNSDSGDYRTCAIDRGMCDKKAKDAVSTSCTNRGCVFGEPTCCIL